MDGLKQRIVGALVLVSLAVIFVPMIFDEPHSERTSNSIQIPEEPPFPEVAIPEDEAGAEPGAGRSGGSTSTEEGAAAQSQSAPGYRIVEEEPAPFEGVPDVDQAPEPAPKPEVKVAPVLSQPEPKKTEPEVAATAKLAEPTVSAGDWVVQLGSFGNADNARRLRDQVRDKGYGSHLEATKRGDATLTRVFSGPFPDRASAEAAKRTLDEAFSLNSLVTTSDK